MLARWVGGHARSKQEPLMSTGLRLAVLTAAMIAGTATGCLAQTAPQAASPPPYRPGLGDLMTMTVQPRHLKLGIAGRERNWPYAAYEHHQLEEALERVARTWPRWRQFPIGDMMLITKSSMDALAQAIKES